jgi:hypothetical protein
MGLAALSIMHLTVQMMHSRIQYLAQQAIVCRGQLPEVHAPLCSPEWRLAHGGALHCVGTLVGGPLRGLDCRAEPGGLIPDRGPPLLLLLPGQRGAPPWEAQQLRHLHTTAEQAGHRRRAWNHHGASTASDRSGGKPDQQLASECVSERDWPSSRRCCKVEQKGEGTGALRTLSEEEGLVRPKPQAWHVPKLLETSSPPQGGGHVKGLVPMSKSLAAPAWTTETAY